MSINLDNLTYNYYSDEFIYLLNFYYPHHHYYNFFVNKYNYIISSNLQNLEDITYFDKDVVSLMTTFSKGSLHGFSGFYYIYITYLNNFENYKDKDIIIYKDIEPGFLSILNYLRNTRAINTNIIYLEKEKKYKFKSVTYIPNKFHVFKPELENMVDCFIEKYKIIGNKNNINQKICIIKSDISNTNISGNGIFNNNIVEQFCNKYNIRRIFPKDEIELINLIYSCKILILSYGSTFFKNYIYISDSCEKIIVIIKGDCYINDYKNLCKPSPSLHQFQGNIYNKYKNAVIKYIFVDNDLKFDPNII
jgi:hypothetical protein